MERALARSLVFACVGVLVCLFAARTAEAQFDHLKCYKAKDQKAFKSARADITALQTQFGVAEDCQIKPKAKLFCVPATKTVTSIEEGTDSPFPAEELGFDRLCYSIKCPKVEIAPEEVSDQFGTRELEKFKAAMLCTPTVKGPPPTTSTTMPACADGAMQACGSNVGTCQEGTQTCSSGTFGPCVGEVEPAPELCDGLDNDCDGAIDEDPAGLGMPCDGPDSDGCEEGFTVCSGGALVCDDATGDNVEICNMIDDDCDGTIDEGFDLMTDPNNCGTCGTMCMGGTPNCTAGVCVP